ncbi:hypothetical protein [Streptomyces sp. NPDC003832]
MTDEHAARPHKNETKAVTGPKAVTAFAVPPPSIRAASLHSPPRRLGRALHYRLGDGSRAEEGWGRLRELLGRVRKP